MLTVRRPMLAAPIVVLGLLVATLGGCEKDPRETSRFPRADEVDGLDRRVSEVQHVRLDNGINVYLREEHSDEMVAVEVLYRAGFFHEPEGKAQVSHVTEHVLVHAASASYQPEESLQKLLRYGRAAAQAIGDCVHFDYVVPYEKLDETLSIEAEHLTSVRFHQDVIDREATRAAGEIEATLNSDQGAMTKFAFIALNQIYNYGARHVPVHQATFAYKPEDLKAFHDAHYRPEDMVIAIVGGIDLAEAEAMVRKHFGGIAGRPAPAAPTPRLSKDVNATWDVPAEVIYLVFPGPYTDVRERLMLTTFGSYLRGYIASSPAAQALTQSVYVSNQVYPVREIPFFIFAQPASRRSINEVKTELLALTEQAVAAMDDRMVARLRLNVKSFMESSLIKSANAYIPRDQFLGQEALNTALKHYARDGLEMDEFYQIVDSITPEDLRATLNRYLSPQNMKVVTLRPQ